MLALRQTYAIYAAAICLFLLFIGAGYKHVYTLPLTCAEMPTRELKAFCAKMEKAKSRPIVDKRLRIMPVGDSVTAGPMGLNAYRGDLVEMLAPTNDLEMVGEVYWGTMKEEKYNRLEAMMGRNIGEIYASLEISLPKWKPNVILLHCGTNEIIGNKEDELAVLPHRLDDIMELVSREAPDALLLVAQVIPCAFRGDKVERWNEQVYERVAKRVYDTKQKILTVDMYTGWPDDGLGDVAHPNQLGYKVMADRWLAKMEKGNGMGWLKSSNAHTEPPAKKPAEPPAKPPAEKPAE